MKKPISLIVAAIAGLIFIFCMNVVPFSASLSGIVLPFGWQGPYHLVTSDTPYDRNRGLPFTVVKLDQNLDHYYSDMAVGLNILSGILIGVSGMAVVKKR